MTVTATQTLCRHCGKLPHDRPRGLCWKCFGQRSIRDQYERDESRPSTLCKHCAKKRANRPRGLCWGCYHAPGVKCLYKRRFVATIEDLIIPTRMPTPTTAMPGSPEKIEILRQRVEAGEFLFHPMDAKG